MLCPAHKIPDRLAPAAEPGASSRAPKNGHAATSTAYERPAARAKSSAAPDEVRWIFDAAADMGVDEQRFEAYADKRWGKGWKVAAGGRKRALDEVTAFAEDGKGFQEKVRAELEDFA